MGIARTPDEPFALGDQRLIVNPGSVGQPRDGDPRASAMMLDTDGTNDEWRRVEYPIERVQKLMTEPGCRTA